MIYNRSYLSPCFSVLSGVHRTDYVLPSLNGYNRSSLSKGIQSVFFKFNQRMELGISIIVTFSAIIYTFRA